MKFVGVSGGEGAFGLIRCLRSGFLEILGPGLVLTQREEIRHGAREILEAREEPREVVAYPNSYQNTKAHTPPEPEDRLLRLSQEVIELTRGQMLGHTQPSYEERREKEPHDYDDQKEKKRKRHRERGTEED